jgi:hypothetical protein
MFVNIDHRIPENSNRSSRWIDNIVFNWGTYANQWLGAETIDVINSKFITGNLNAGAQPHPIHFTQNSPEMCGTPSGYLAGNIWGAPGTNTVNASPWSLAVATNGENAQSETDTSPGLCPQATNTPGIPVPSGWQRSTPMAASNAFPIPLDAAPSLDTILLPTVGNSQHLDCNGNPVSHRDPQDARIIAQYQNGTSGGYWPNDTTEAGVVPLNLTPTAQWQDSPVVGFPVCTESLHDGIPDQWKNNHGFSLTDTGLHNRIDPTTGLTYLEDYLDGLNP